MRSKIGCVNSSSFAIFACSFVLQACVRCCDMRVSLNSMFSQRLALRTVSNQEVVMMSRGYVDASSLAQPPLSVAQVLTSAAREVRTDDRPELVLVILPERAEEIRNKVKHWGDCLMGARFVLLYFFPDPSQVFSLNVCGKTG